MAVGNTAPNCASGIEERLRWEIIELEVKIYKLEVENRILKDMNMKKEYIPYPNNGTPTVWEWTNTW